ncbi:DNA-binding transcriptional MerR regulator [Peribacillus deserti]|uniref:DNA-binding transcriptional MerR regulator n=1 Tax=Peribacillus deserti TaxID=673318 RepID=A0ABS2QCL4_9BACI|nr:anti-repressor SinI family protein [Peribacillus deserti]MBM7690903.1 DNA-binding transcriptional MerR regulator [Peribacillus deserti]
MLITVPELDQEWVELLLQAKKMGMNLEDIREFLQSAQEQKEVV